MSEESSYQHPHLRETSLLSTREFVQYHGHHGIISSGETSNSSGQQDRRDIMIFTHKSSWSIAFDDLTSDSTIVISVLHCCK